MPTNTATRALKQALTAQDGESLVVGAAIKLKGRRRHQANLEQSVTQILEAVAPYAAITLRENVYRKRGYKHLPPDLHRSCEFIIEQVVGKARQKVEHSGSVMTYGDLAKSAESLEKQKPRLLIEVETPIEAEVRELSNTIVAPEPLPDEAQPKSSPVIAEVVEDTGKGEG